MQEILKSIKELELNYEVQQILMDIVYHLDKDCKVLVKDFSFLRFQEMAFLAENGYIEVKDDKIYFTKEFIEFLPGLQNFIKNNRNKCRVKFMEEKIKEKYRDLKYKAYLAFVLEVNAYAKNFKLIYNNDIINFGNVVYKIGFDDKAMVKVSVIARSSGNYVMSEDEIGFWEWFIIQNVHSVILNYEDMELAELRRLYNIKISK